VNDTLKWALIGVGGFLLLRSMSGAAQQSAVPSNRQGVAPVDSTQGTAPATQGTAPASNTQPQQPAVNPNTLYLKQGAPPPDDVLMQAAVDASKASLPGDYRFNWWQWNYYRSRGAEKYLGVANADAEPQKWAPVLSIPPEQLITATEYHRLLQQAGVE
jgi:hypothetical protein